MSGEELEVRYAELRERHERLLRFCRSMRDAYSGEIRDLERQVLELRQGQELVNHDR